MSKPKAKTKKRTSRKAVAKAPTVPTVLVLRTCTAQMTGNHNAKAKAFVWPKSGPVACDDWDPSPVCGYGLHGLLWGCGDGQMLSWDESAIWLVVEVLESDIVDLNNKVKFPRGVVVFAGNRKGATDYIYLRRPGAVAGVSVTGGDDATVTGGDAATVTGGDAATVTGGYAATVTGGDDATVTGGARAKVTGGARAKVTGGYDATVTGGDAATVTGGDDATVTGGDAATVTGGARAKVTGGYAATVTGGDAATVTGGYAATVTGGDAATVTGSYAATVTGGDDATVTGGARAKVTGGARAKVTGGDGAIICIKHWDGRRWRLLIGYVGEDGIEAGKPYKVSTEGKIVRADQ